MDATLIELLEAWREAADDTEREERENAIRKHLMPKPENPDRRVFEAAAAVLTVTSDNPQYPKQAAEAERILRAAFAGGLQPLVDWHGKPEPEPVLWRDADTGYADAVLSVGEIAILAAPGGTGKTYLTLALARAATRELDRRAPGFGRTCGLRVRPGPVVLVSYEDAPVRIAARLAAMGGVPANVHCWPNPGPLFVAGGEGTHRGEAIPTPTWSTMWEAIRSMVPTLVVIDPASAALSNVSLSESGPVRAFMGALAREAAQARCGILVVAHDTKTARNEVRAGGDPGAGAVAGSATWFDAARGVLYLARKKDNTRMLTCIKANYGTMDWKVTLRERFADGRFAGFEEVAATPAPERPSP